ncbi:hypothetical protein Tco_1267320 [Tanacetum coccineum]
MQEKDTTINKLRNHIKYLREIDQKDKVKQDIDEIETINIELEHRMFKLDLEPLSPKLFNNKEARIHYLTTTKEQDDILRGIVEQARAKQPLYSALDFVCKHVIRIQELLVYVRDTCPSVNKSSEKLIGVTPHNKNKKVRFAKPVTLQSNTKQQVGSHNTLDSNKPMLTSTGLKSSTSASKSQPSSNTKNNRILQTTSSNQKNKVKDHLRKVKSKSNKMNRVVEPICNADVKHSMLKENSELICATCNQCMFDAIHDMCILDFVKDVNVRSKSKSAKSNKKQNIWKPMGKVFTDVGYRWKPIGRTFTLNGISCPLTRITSTKVAHLKETTSKSIETQKSEIKVYSRRPKPIKSVGSSSKSKIVVFGITNTTETNQSWGSNASDVPSSSSLVDFRLSRLFSGIWTLDAPSI